MKSAVAIRHVPFEDLGSWEPQIINAGYRLSYVDAGIDDLEQLHHQPIDLLCVLGGPIGAYQEVEYPFLLDEFKLLEERLKNDLPTLGICLGSQLIARVLGSRVYPNTQKEIGWYSLELTPEGRNSCINYYDKDQTSMFHWHGDTFDLPSGATLLASTDLCRNQIYSWGNQCLAFQCHPEVLPKRLEQWWIGHAGELDSLKLSAQSLRQQTAKYGAALVKQSEKCLSDWLQTLSIDDKTPEYLYKILSLENWQASQGKQTFVLDAMDKPFIHLAREDQVAHVIQKFWNQKEYVLIQLSRLKLEGRLVYETNPGGSTKYYHLYEGSIPLAAVVKRM